MIGLWIVIGDEVSISSVEEIPQENTKNYTIIPSVADSNLITPKEFRLVSDKSVIFLTSTWCRRCNYLLNSFYDQSELYSGIKFYVVDIDLNRELTNEFGIHLSPGLIFIDQTSYAFESEINRDDIISDLNFFANVGVNALPVSYTKF